MKSNDKNDNGTMLMKLEIKKLVELKTKIECKYNKLFLKESLS